jgi:hypothetical protein
MIEKDRWKDFRGWCANKGPPSRPLTTRKLELVLPQSTNGLC